MTDTAGIETTTVHDYKPTHRFAPPEVAEARENVFAAWAEHDAMIEMHEIGEIGIEQVREAGKRAVQAETEYRRLWMSWQNEPTAAPAECTCTPFIGGLCPVCLADNKRRYGDEIPY